MNLQKWWGRGRVVRVLMPALFVMTGCVRGEEQAQPAAGIPAESQPDAAAWKAYLTAVDEAERIEDVVERCRAYPDLPGNAWPAGSARARCPLLGGASPTLAEVESMLANPDGPARLEHEYQALLDAHYAEPERGEPIYRAYEGFFVRRRHAACRRAMARNICKTRRCATWPLRCRKRRASVPIRCSSATSASPRKQKATCKALGYLSQTLHLAPNNTQFLGARADVRRKLGDLEGAVVDTRRAIALNDSSGRNHTVLGQSLFKLGRVEEAREAYQRAMQFPTQRQWAFRRWCETYILGGVQRDEALACTQGLLSEYPDDAEAMFMRSWVLYELGDPAAAEAAARFHAAADMKDHRQRQMASELARIAK